jgi:hypothetical protein
MPTNNLLPTIYAWLNAYESQPKKLFRDGAFERRLWKRERQCESLASAVGINIDDAREYVRRASYVNAYVTNSPFGSEAHAIDVMAEFALDERDRNPPSLETIRQWKEDFRHGTPTFGESA